MSSIILEEVNNHHVGPIPIPPEYRRVRASELVAECYANIALIAKKKSGKTSVIFHFLKHCVGKYTNVIIFCSTVNKDKGWLEIQRYLTKKNVLFEAYGDLYEDGINKLREIIDVLDAEAKEKQEELMKEKNEEEDRHEKLKKLMCCIPEKKEGKKCKKEKLLSPDFIFIFDDLSHRLHDPAVVELLCRNRHYLCKTIISTQYIHQIALACRKQIDLYIIFRGLPLEKIKEIAKDADISITLELFWKIYRKATKEKHSFLYLATGNDEMRCNFNKQFILKDTDQDDENEH